MASSATGAGRSRRWAGGRSRRVVTRPGSGLSEEPVPGVRAGRAGDKVVPRLPSRAPGDRRGLAGAGGQRCADGVADPAVEAAQRFLVRLAFGDLFLLAGPAVAVLVP